jgi:hypothetical protein
VFASFRAVALFLAACSEQLFTHLSRLSWQNKALQQRKEANPRTDTEKRRSEDFSPNTSQGLANGEPQQRKEDHDIIHEAMGNRATTEMKHL